MKDASREQLKGWQLGKELSCLVLTLAISASVAGGVVQVGLGEDKGREDRKDFFWLGRQTAYKTTELYCKIENGYNRLREYLK